MFFKKEKEKKDFDRRTAEAAIMTGICSGEKTFGFIDKQTGKFNSVCLIRSQKELGKILASYSLSEKEVKHIY